MDRLLTITRYYAAAQLEQALLVRRLRAAELPIGALREYLAAAPERRRAILEGHVVSFRRRAADVERAVGRLRGELEDRSCAVAPAAFASALGQVSFAVADPAVRAELGAVCVETKDDSLRLVARAGRPAARRPRLRLEFETDRLVLDGRATVAGTWPGPELTMLVDPRFFAEAVRATVGPDLVVEAFDPLRPITLRSADTGTFSVLTMPIRP